MPLYACERCGYTSAAFRPEAARLHRLEYPQCDGVMRIIFRSEERYRGELYTPPTARPPAAPMNTQEAQPAALPSDHAFEIRETVDSDQTLRLAVCGDLDLTAAAAFSTRLAGLKATGRPCRLDLSRVAFIDSSGIQALLLALTDARWSGWPLDVARAVSPSVERAAQIVGIAQILWPPEPGPNQPGPPLAQPTSSA